VKVLTLENPAPD